MNKKLTKSATDKVLTGVLGGISKYFNWNSTAVRIIFVILCLLPGLKFIGLVCYLLAVILIPSSSKRTGFGGFTDQFTASSKQPNRSRKHLTDVEESNVEEK